jgi:hypothetical protein
MNVLIINFLAAFLLSFSIEKNALHDFKLSVCEVVYAPSKTVFEVKFYIFTDDFKAVLYNDPNASSIDEKTAVNYLSKHFRLDAGGIDQTLNFVAMQEKNDQILIRFTSANIELKALKKLTIHNDLLVEKFITQINMVYAVFPDRSKMTQMLSATKTEAVFTL